MLHTFFSLEMGPLVPEKILKGFTIHGARLPSLSYDPDAAPTNGGSTQNLARIGLEVSEENMFEIVDARRTEGRRIMGKLTW